MQELLSVVHHDIMCVILMLLSVEPTNVPIIEILYSNVHYGLGSQRRLF